MTRIIQISTAIVIIALTLGLIWLQWGFQPSDLEPVISVDVLEGNVNVKNPLGEVALAAGEKAVVTPGGEPVKQQTIQTEATPIPVMESTSPVQLTIVNETGERVQNPSIRFTEKGAEITHYSSTQDEPVLVKVRDGSSPSVIAGAQGYFDSEPVPLAGESSITITLYRGLGIEGKVIDESGNEVADAIVSVAGNRQVKAVTGSPFILSPLPPGEHRVAVSHDRLLGEEKTVNTGEKNLILQLSSSANVIVSVSTENGEPVEGMDVDIRAEPESGFVFSNKAKSSAHGMVTFSQIQKGIYTIGVEDPSYYSPHRTTVEVDMAREQVGITIPNHDYTIAGYVYDAATRQPIPNAPVICGVERRDEQYSPLLRYTGMISDNQVLPASQSVTTDRNGFYQFDGLYGGQYIIYVDRMKEYMSGFDGQMEEAGLLNYKRVILSRAASSGQVDFYLSKSWHVSGTVYGPNNTPLPGAAVHYRVVFRQSNIHGSREANVSALSDGNGRYDLYGTLDVHSSDLLVYAKHTEYGIAQTQKVVPFSGEHIEGVDFHFGSMRTVKGIVTDTSGNPVPGADVMFYAGWVGYEAEYSNGENYTNYTFPIFSAVTGSDGKYTCIVPVEVPEWYRGLDYETDLFTAKASAGGYLRSTIKDPERMIKMPPPNQSVTCNFILQTGSEEITGRVVNETGEGLSEIILSMHLSGRSLGVGTFTVSGDNGEFRLDLGRFDPKFLEPQERRGGPQEKPFLITAEPTAEYQPDPANRYTQADWGEQNVRIVMQKIEQKKVQLSGYVINADGEVQTDYLLAVLPDDKSRFSLQYQYSHPYYYWTTVHSADGSFHITDLPEVHAPFHVAVKCKEYALALSPPLSPDESGVIEEVAIRVGNGATVSGQFIDHETREPLAGVSITVLPSSIEYISGGLGITRNQGESKPILNPSVTSFTTQTVTDERGRFTIHGVPVPQAYFRIDKIGYIPVTQSVDTIRQGNSVDFGVYHLLTELREGEETE